MLQLIGASLAWSPSGYTIEHWRARQAQGHHQRIEHTAGIDAATHGPADHLTREQIDHHGQVRPALMGADVGDIGHPRLIGLRHGELALQVVGRDDRRLATTHTRATAVAGLAAHHAGEMRRGRSARSCALGAETGWLDKGDCAPMQLPER